MNEHEHRFDTVIDSVYSYVNKDVAQSNMDNGIVTPYSRITATKVMCSGCLEVKDI